MEITNSRIKRSFFIMLLWWATRGTCSGLAMEDFDKINYMNLSADPCQDFYEYTCGNFKNVHPLQEGTILIDQFTLLEDKLAEEVNDILKSGIKNSDPIALQKAKAAYEACVDHNYMDAIDVVSPELQVVKKYGGFPVIGRTFEMQAAGSIASESPPPFGWYDIADIAAEFGISIFLTPTLYYDPKNVSRNILMISTDAMEIPVEIRPKPPESYEEAIEEGFIAMANQPNKNLNVNSLRAASESIPAMEVLLRNLVLKLKRILGSDRDDEYLFERVANISNFMKGIYYGGYTPPGTVVSPIAKNTNATVVSLKELNEWTYKHFGDDVQLDWVEYVKRLVQYTHVDVDENFLVLHMSSLPATLYGVLNWVRMNDEEVVKSATLLRTFVYTAADSDSESKTYFEKYLKAIGKTVYPRWKYCSRKIMDATGTLSLSLAVTYEYQLRHFNSSKLQEALLLIDNLQTTFKEVIEEASWMDESSKAAAQSKADKIISLLGYPHFVKHPDLLDHFYENLQITTWNHYENAKKIRAFQQAYTLNMLSLRERKAWEKSPFDVNAFYNRQNNRIIFPIAMLNPVFFQGSSRILDYSRIGMIIAHEMTHGFDRQGFLYNPYGVVEPWWSETTIANFSIKNKCFIEQYSEYSIPEINVKMNGSSSLNENLADNGGFRTAFKAFQKLLLSSVSRKVVPKNPTQFSPEQLFFIGYGTMWCNSESITYLKSLEKSCATSINCHARANMRVNGVVSNMEAFAKAFNCPVDSPMNPERKCRLW